MPNKILLKKSSVAAKEPTVSDLDYGELALNYADGKLYFKNSSNVIDSFSAAVDAGPSLTISTSPPVGPSHGDVWIDSNTGTKYTYLDDGDTSQWVEIEAELSVTIGDTGGAPAVSDAVLFEGVTTNATETELFVGGVSGSRLQVTTGTSMYYTVDVSCRRTDGTDYAAFTLKGMIANVGGTVSDIGSIYEIIVVRTDGGLTVDARADVANGSLGVYVTGIASKSFNWNARLTYVET